MLLVAFIWVERGQEHPTLRLCMFRNVTFSAANLANLLEGVAMITALVQVPMFAYTTVSATPIEGGLLVIRMTVMIPIGAVIGGLLVNRISHRWTAAAGFRHGGRRHVPGQPLARWTSPARCRPAT